MKLDVGLPRVYAHQPAYQWTTTLVIVVGRMPTFETLTVTTVLSDASPPVILMFGRTLTSKRGRSRYHLYTSHTRTIDDTPAPHHAAQSLELAITLRCMEVHKC